MPDVRLENAEDGGEMEFVNGAATMDPGVGTAVFLSLFGGNEDDSGLTGDNAKQWWGNLSETLPARKYRSETQALLRSLPLIPANLRRIEDAAARDLAWMVDELTASIETRATIPAVNHVRLEIAVTIDGRTSRYTFDEIRS